MLTSFSSSTNVFKNIAYLFFFPMKPLLFRLPFGRKSIRPPEEPQALEPTQSIFPNEIWRQIIGYTVRGTGAKYVDLEDPFVQPWMMEEYPEIDPGLLNDRRSLSQVCASWRNIVEEISAEYLVIYTGQQLRSIVKIFEKSKLSMAGEDVKHLGERTLRIDFRILGEYKVSHVIRLLKCTPNLAIYYNKNGPADQPERPAPIEVLKGLADFCGSTLRRLEWASAGEAPRYEDLVQLCNSIPDLVTLRLVAIHSFPRQIGINFPGLTLPKLKTLSLGLIPEIHNPRSNYALTWDPFLHLLSRNNRQLPSLERLDCEIFPLLTPAFFTMYGPKIRHFRTTAWSAENELPTALNFCQNLHTLVIVQGSENMAMPAAHLSIQRICIIPSIDVPVEVPPRVFKHAVLQPLDNLLKVIEVMNTPRLREVRVRNVGSYSTIGQHHTMTFWWIRWNLQRVNFTDKTGQTIGDSNPRAQDDRE